MAAIHLLSEKMINQIAAGEIVERPSSIVKELVENSIDAGAKNIIIELEKGGIERIHVKDDGNGIEKQDLPLAVHKYATSKIASIEDLLSIHTLGFRGEALASIAAVSVFELQTKTAATPVGFCYNNKEQTWTLTEKGLPQGTSVSVSRLFYNLPARKKFLKAPATEYQQILEILTDIALIYPQISFKLLHNQQLIFHYPNTTEWVERITQVLGKTIFETLIPIQQKTEYLEIRGFISKPLHVFPTRKQQYFSINQRPIRDPIVFRALHNAYQNLIPGNTYPISLLKLAVAPELVDVNVHPRKSEVKFSHPQAIYQAVFQTVKQGLEDQDRNLFAVLKNFVLNQKSIQKNREMNTFSAQSKLSLNNTWNKPSAMRFSSGSQDQMRVYEKLREQTASSLRSISTGMEKIVTQISQKYILVETMDSLLFFDQHAVSEGIIYQKLLDQIRSGTIQIQKLFLPLHLQLPPALSQQLFAEEQTFRALGFSMEEFGKNTIIISDVPAVIAQTSIEKTVFSLLEELHDNPDLKNLSDHAMKKQKILMTLACKSARKFGDAISLEEQTQLLKETREWHVQNCAHGRPICWEISFQELNKKFARC